MTHATINDFIEHEIMPTLGEFAQDFDARSIAEEVSEYDGRGFVWKAEYKDDIEAYNAVCQKHDKAGR